MFGKKKGEENESKEQIGELNEAVPKKTPKVSKGFGNTIILFIVFFIVFTIIVTGVAFFADKLDFSGKKPEKTLEDITQEKVTDPKATETTEYTLDDKGKLDKKSEEAKADEELVIPAAASPAVAAAPKPAPLPPVDIKPVIKQPEPAKAPAPKPAPVKKEQKTEPVKDSSKTLIIQAAPTTNFLGDLTKKVTTGDFVVQIASFQNEKYAESEKTKLARLLPDVFVVRVDLGEKGVWYRVRSFNGIGYQEAKAKALAIASKTSHKPYPMKK